MPFGLTNTGTTYQWCMQRCFTDQIDPLDQPDQVERPKPTIAIYVDDIVVKTAQASDLIANLAATFANLQRFNVKLNPKKMCFRGSEGEAAWIHRVRAWHRSQPKKIMAISNMGPIRNVKGLQRLTSCLAALSQFIS